MELATEARGASRYVVGFDLGTTNSAVTYIDTDESPWRVRTFSVGQLVAPSQVESLETLPSFHYEPASGEFLTEALRLPFGPPNRGYVVGAFARDHGGQVAGRLIASAKSWLCHTGVDRTAPLLPWHGAADVERLSPLDVSGRYLAHVREAWNARFPEHPLESQDFVLTLPASFDEVARELTVKAAAMAGLPRVVLIEEPQAAFYAWIDAHRDDWERLVSPGQKILVCDIGGGTTDFTLIRVRSDSEGRARFHRVAVGDHLILGGDNLDLALAHFLEKKLTSGGKLPSRQWTGLLRGARLAKEAMLMSGGPERLTVTLPGAGAKLLSGGVQVELTRREVHEVLLEGFLPRVGLDARPSRRTLGFQEFGLPYAPDPAMTRYLAAFLSAHRHVALDDVEVAPDVDPARPDIVLFNGGFFASDVLRQRLLDVLTGWFQPPSGAPWSPIVLDNRRLDLAVAHGAAYYGMVRRGQGVRINAGLARTYYVAVERRAEAESPTPEEAGLAPDQAVDALCLLPAGTEPGVAVVLEERTFDLLVNQPVEFPLFVSSTRLTDKPGELVPLDREQVTGLPPIRTVLRSRKKRETESLRVRLEAGLTEIGTLDLWCVEVDGRGRWRLQFDVRSATQTDIVARETRSEAEGVYEESTWEAIDAVLESVFGSKGKESAAGLMKRLAVASEMNKAAWPASLLRRMADRLMELEPSRRRSQEHEARWLNLLGYALRPGYGLAMDDFRVNELWTRLHGALHHATPGCRAEWWILWRRVAGGLVAGQQIELANPLLRSIRAVHRQLTTGQGRGGEIGAGTHEMAEIWRLLGSLELLPAATKAELGDMLVALLPKKRIEASRSAAIWALGRLGARQPLYGPLNTVVAAEKATAWARWLRKQEWDDPTLAMALMELARRTDDRYRDVDDAAREEVLGWLERHGAPEHFLHLVRDGGTLDAEEEGLLFGDSLPLGLRLQ